MRAPDGLTGTPETGSSPAASGGFRDLEVRHQRLLELADEQATGALHVNGRTGGTIFFVRGRIGYVESALVPGVEALLLRPTYPDERRWAMLISSLRRGETAPAVVAAGQLIRAPSTSPVHVEILRRSALADAALTTLGVTIPETPRTRPRFRPGERHWCEPVRTFSVPNLLAEVNRRRAVLSRMTLGVRPDRVVHRVSQLPFGQIRLSATQWNIARLADGRSTPFDIAWMLGHGGFATTVAVHQLARLGVLTTGPDVPESQLPGLVPARHVLSFVRAGTGS